MNLSKIPGLKGLVAHTQGRRRFKGELTPDMISHPLGDFRHTMHVGRGGDVFGDTSFLSNHGGAGDSEATTPDKSEGFFSRTLRHVRKSPGRPEGGAKELSPPPPPISPIIKNAISLPRLDVEPPIGNPTKELFPCFPGSAEEPTHTYGLESGFVTLPCLSGGERQQQPGFVTCSPEVHRGFPAALTRCDPATRSDSDSMSSFTLDLGPSLMSEVFGMIDSPDGHLEARNGWEGEALAFGGANDSLEMDSATVSLVDSLLREDYNSLDWEEDAEVNGGAVRKTINHLGMGSSPKEESSVAAEFPRASDMLPRGAGTAGLQWPRGAGTAGLQWTGPHADMSGPSRRRAAFGYPEDEEEIKV